MIGARREISRKLAELAAGSGDQVGERCVGGEDDPVPGLLEGGADAGQGRDVAAATDCCDGYGAHDGPPTMRPKISVRYPA